MERSLVGHRLDPAQPGAAVGADGALVHLAERRPGAAVDDEVAALLAAAGPHVVRLLDVATAPGGDVVLVVEHLPHRLVELLAVPGWPTPGEAVTVLVPIAQAVSALGDARVRHGAVGPSAVRFDDAGRPVLVGFEAAAPMAPLEDGAMDAAALRLLATRVLARAGAEEAARRVAVDAPSPAALVELLFDVADPRPVRLRPEPASASNDTTPSRLVGVGPDPGAGATAAAKRVLPSLADRLRRAALALAARARPVRRRTWAAAGASAALLVAALVLLPSHPGGAAATAAADPSSAAPRGTSAVPSRQVRSTAPSSSPEPIASPLPAVRALVAARASCLRRADAACLDDVDAAGSPLGIDDGAAIRAGAEAAPTPTGSARLLSAAGSTAVVAIGDAVLLALHGPEGWRLRDLTR